MITKYKDINGDTIKVSTKVDKILSIDNGIESITRLLKVEETNSDIFMSNYPKNYGSFKNESDFHSELRGQLLADNLEIL